MPICFFTKGMINLKKIFTLLMILILAVNLPAQAVLATEPEDVSTSTDADSNISKPDITSSAAIVMNADTGQILYEKSAYDKMYPASLTKIMTALITLEEGDLASTVTMSETAVYGIDPESSHIALSVGEELSLEDALYGVMLASANEASLGIAEHLSGSNEAFCSKMNDRARSLGCTSTNFMNPNGLHDDNHYSTAYDLALITKEALSHEKFIDICSTKYYEIPATNKADKRGLTQNNKLLYEDSDYYYEYCFGGKTGYTQKAQGTLASWAKKDGMTLICITLNAPSNAENFYDTKALYDYCFANYKQVSPLSGYAFSEEDLTMAENHLNKYYGGKNLGTFSLEIDTSASVSMPKDFSSSAQNIKFLLSTDRLTENILGSLVVTYDNVEYLRVPVKYSGYINSEDEEAVQAAIAAGIIKKPKEKASPIKTFFIILLVILILGAALALFLRIQYVKRQRAAYRRRRDIARKKGKSF